MNAVVATENKSAYLPWNGDRGGLDRDLATLEAYHRGERVKGGQHLVFGKGGLTQGTCRPPFVVGVPLSGEVERERLGSHAHRETHEEIRLIEDPENWGEVCSRG